MTVPHGFITRPPAQIFGSHAAYGMAGYGVSSATGNLTLTALDLVLADGYLGWARTYNALDDTAGIMGRGWTPALAAHLVPGQPGGGGPVMLFADDGRQLPFTPDGHGGFTKPADLDADLAQNTDGSFTLSFLSGEIWQFDAAGRLASQSVPGIQVTFGYDAQGRLATASSSAGGQLSLGYNGAGRLATVESGDGRAVSYSYTDDGSLSAATTPRGTTRYATASGGLLGRVTGPDGNLVVTSTYDAQGRVQHQDYPAGGADFGYDDATGTTTVTRVPSGARVSYDHDAAGRVVRLVDPAGNAVTFGFDDAGHVVSASGPAGLTVARTLDSAGNVRAELLRRAEQDQAARREPEPDLELLNSVDADNLAWLKDVVAEIGWPGRSVAGKDGAHAAWLLAQHADRDPAFQRTCLDLMTEAAGRGEASYTDVAYLTDRVLLAEGRPQEYGTQMRARAGGWAPRRLADPEHVDERRAAVSLGPLADYIASIERAYGPAKPMRIQCGGCGGRIDVWPPEKVEKLSVTCPACGWATTLGPPAS